MSRLSSVGHSFGACTNISLCREDRRFKASVAHDVWLFPASAEMAQVSPRPLPPLRPLSAMAMLARGDRLSRDRVGIGGARRGIGSRGVK